MGDSTLYPDEPPRRKSDQEGTPRIKKERIRLPLSIIDDINEEEGWYPRKGDMIRELAEYRIKYQQREERREVARQKVRARNRAARIKASIARRAERARPQLTEIADPIVLRLMNDITVAKNTERAAWSKLAKYLAGEDIGERVRIRIRLNEVTK